MIDTPGYPGLDRCRRSAHWRRCRHGGSSRSTRMSGIEVNTRRVFEEAGNAGPGTHSSCITKMDTGQRGLCRAYGRLDPGRCLAASCVLCSTCRSDWGSELEAVWRAHSRCPSNTGRRSGGSGGNQPIASWNRSSMADEAVMERYFEGEMPSGRGAFSRLMVRGHRRKARWCRSCASVGEDGDRRERSCWTCWPPCGPAPVTVRAQGQEPTANEVEAGKPDAAGPLSPRCSRPASTRSSSG